MPDLPGEAPATGPDRLTALDTAFLHIEREGLPVHIGSVGLFDGGPLLDDQGVLRLEELRAQVDSRLDRLPRLRRRVAWPPIGFSRPVWVDDPDFDVADHVQAVELPPSAGPDGLRRLAEQLAAETLPTDRPLWHLLLVTGLPGGRVGIIERVHHSLVDGVSGVDVATTLFDAAPDPEPIVPSTWVPDTPPTGRSLALDGLRSQMALPFGLLRSAGTALTHPTRLARQGAAVVGALGKVVRDGLVAPDWPLNEPVGADRSLAWVRVALDDAKAAGRHHHATANDVVLAAVAHGLRELLLDRGHGVALDAAVKVLVPVSLRADDQKGSLGNRVGALLLRLPIGLADPAFRLRAIARSTAHLKASREAPTAALLLAAADLLPAPVTARLAHLTDAQRLINVIVTNVPGPPFPLYCRGARLLEAFPMVPLGGNTGVGVAILSYDGTLSLSITADPASVPDADVLRLGIEAGFATMGVTPWPIGVEDQAPRRSAQAADG